MVDNTRIRFVSVQGRCNRYTQPFRFKVAVTELERFGVDMAATGCGRDRNKVKFSKWGFYGKDEHQNIMQSLRDAGKTQKSRVPGGYQPLVFTKVSKNKFEIAWPLGVGADPCIRFLKLALGNKWRNFVTDPAGVRGTAEAPVSRRGASSLAAATVASATAEARSGVNLLALKLEAFTRLYGSKEPERFEDLQSAYTVNWAAELGRGTYGKVYVGTRRWEGGGFAIKMLRDKADDAPKGGSKRMPSPRLKRRSGDTLLWACTRTSLG